jgi:hypothetical protein
MKASLVQIPVLQRIQKQSDWDHLLSAACDGRASDKEMERLAELIRTHPGLRDDYLFYVDTHACLDVDCADPALTLAPKSPRPHPLLRLLPAWAPGLAAGLVASALLALAGRALWGWETSRDRFLAVVTNADGALWEGGDASVMIGSAIGPGLLELCEGRVELELDNGVRLAVEGPARFELESLAHGILHQGSLAAMVPPQGVGFKIDTPTLSVVDLGTEFALRVAENGVSDVHVFEGEVEASMRNRPDGGDRRLLGSSATRRAKPSGSRLEAVDFDPAQFVTPPQVLAGVERVSGGVRVLANPPETVRPGTYQHNYMLLFQEQSGVELESVLPISFSGPGCHQIRGPLAAAGPAASLRPGSRIDSYFVHYDVRRGEKQSRVRSTVRFQRPILAVISGETLMTRTDDLLGSWCTRYAGPGRGIKSPNDDLVTISGDHRTLTLDWGFDGTADQIRVLVESGD